MKQIVGPLSLALALSSAVFAQSTLGTITGVVTDQNGAVVAKAKVEVVNQSTGVAREVVTDGQGVYRATNLDAGTYRVAASASGMAPATRKDLPLLAREVVRLDFQLRVGGTDLKIDVRSDATVVSESLTVSDSKSGNDINSLALNFRATNNTSPLVVANLAPGVQSDQQGNISISGGLPNATSYSIDGVSTQQVRFGGPNTDLFPSVESIAEFKVNTAGNNAEFSQPSDLTITSKSGGNEYHGSGFWFFQRDSLNAKDPFATAKPKLQADAFGATLGGPLSVPHVYDAKNKTFFFFTYEGVRRPQEFLLNQLVPPTPWRNGNLASFNGVIKDPVTGLPFTNNQIPANRINPVSAKALNLLFENPNDANNASIAAPNFNKNLSGDFTVNGYDGRIDHNFSDRHKVYFRITQKDLLNSGTGGDPNYNTKLGTLTSTTSLLNLSGSHNWIIRANLINEFRAGYTFGDYAFNDYPLAKQGDQIVKNLGVIGLPGPPKNGLGGVPEFEISSFLGGISSPGHPRDILNRIFQFSDNLTWVKGAHTFKFGFEFRRYSYQDQITFLIGDEYGDYTFNGSVTGNDFADFLLGYPSSTSFAENGPDGKPFGYHYGGFAQDDWKIRRNLTLSVGLRYEVNPPFDDETRQLGQFDRLYPGGRLITQGQGGLSLVSPSWRKQVGSTPFVTNDVAGLPITLRNTYYGNVQPRLGLAWDLTGNQKTVVRASGGIYSAPILGAVLYSLLGVNTSNFVKFDSTAQNRLIMPNPFGGSSSDLGFPGYRRANQIDLIDPRVVLWNFSLDRNLGWQTLLRLSYTGSKTTGLIYSPDLNQVKPNTGGYAALTATPALRQQNLKYPNFAEVLTRDNGPSAIYNAFTVEVSRRFAGGLTFQNTYTLAYNRTNALGSAPDSLSPNGEGVTGRGDNGGNVLNYYDIASDTGDSIFTRRHRFVSTFLYDLPIGRGKYLLSHISRGADLLVGGWKLTGITLLQTGSFLTPTFTGTDPSGTNPSQRSEGSFQRPDCVSGVNPDASNPTRDQYFNPAAFTVPANNIGRFGSCKVGILHGPGTKTFSASVGKQFKLTEHVALGYEAQFANLFNITNLGLPNTRFANGGSANPSFGKITSTQQGEQAGPRTVQMSLRLSF
jgi:hypothetical protein